MGKLVLIKCTRPCNFQQILSGTDITSYIAREVSRKGGESRKEVTRARQIKRWDISTNPSSTP